MGLSEWAGRGDGHPGEWGSVLSLEDQRSAGYLLKPLLPSVFAQTWVEAMNGVRRDSGGGRGGREGSKCVFSKRKGFWGTKNILMWHSFGQSQEGLECVSPI